MTKFLKGIAIVALSFAAVTFAVDSENFALLTETDSWTVAVDEDAVAPVSTGSVTMNATTGVSATFAFGPNGEPNYPKYGMLAFYDDKNYAEATSIKISYKSSHDFNLTLPQEGLFENGGTQQVVLPASSSAFTSVTKTIDDVTFAHPTWWTDPVADGGEDNTAVPINKALIVGISIEPEIPEAGATMTFELDTLIVSGYTASGIISKNLLGNGKSIALTTNGSQLSFNLPEASKGNYSVSFSTLNGKQIAQTTERFSTGKNSMNLKKLNLANGSYIVNLSKGTASYSGMIIVR